MTTTTSDSAAKKDIQKLQRVIVDALEDVKAQEIVVFDTEKQTALFERVMIASGTSNRQTRALAMSVRDAVNKAGFGKPRVEGEDNGEWIIVDCGSAVVHVMQPAIRIELPIMPESATDVRDLVLHHKPVNHLLPSSVVAYIEAHRLYQ